LHRRLLPLAPASASFLLLASRSQPQQQQQALEHAQRFVLGRSLRQQQRLLERQFEP
jgi:hypothetical protein